MRFLLITLALATFGASVAQERFPSLTGEFADGRSIELPGSLKTPFTVIGLAFGQKAQADLEGWYEPAYLRFVAKHGLFASAYEAEVYFIPLFTGLNKAAYEPSMKKFRKSATSELLDHVVFAKAELDELKEALRLKDKDVPYFFVIDQEGRIVHRTQGPFTDDKLDAIEEILLR
ncbi:MAG: hypothetical protein IPM46_06205 [Flavobacteriales bacterium]|nr:hypothetical protein [Flavobacteriales bacterium]